MSNPAGSDRLFDWKRSPRYCSKHSFPLAHTDRAARSTSGAPGAPADPAGEPSLPAAMELLKKPGAPKQSA